MGCLRSIGCLTVLVIAVAAAYVTRDRWRALLDSRPAATAGWAPVSATNAAVGRRAVESLAAPKGPQYVEMNGAEFASYALHGLVPGSLQAAVIDDRLHVRNDSQPPVEVIGTIDVPRPGVGVFRATEVKVDGVPLPPAVISRILKRPDSAMVSLPTAVGDIRVARGHITLYKKTP
jgi:hypothetical protein